MEEIYSYYKENIDLYDKLDMTKILKQKEEMFQYHPKGFMKKFVKDNYAVSYTHLTLPTT